ncbi:MAG: cobalt-precorrin-5B (C(1))-methyltransferase [Dehalococcoidia bacterium]|nr:cobalt-precorrin-5B (C(1))-methyltransferase [Dehalococcoidia bacterium]
MRTGFTTGTCAAAAAQAATRYLLDGVAPSKVSVRLPNGHDASFAVHASSRGRDDVGDWARCSVIKDAGDDPDVTHGAEIVARVWAAPPGITLLGSEGVGTVTRPGLGLEVGGPAINPVPRRMIVAEVTAAMGNLAGITVEISVPGGEALAKRTLNGRLGIVGGISILGTTGIVRPYSTAAWRASVGQAIDVAAANGIEAIALTTGGRSERYTQQRLGWPDLALVEMGEFTGYALKRARRDRIRRVVLGGMIGKLSKIAAGHMMTHVAGNQVDPAYLASLAAQAGADAASIDAMRAANTARHVQEIAIERGVTGMFAVLASAVVARCTEEVHGGLDIGCLLFDFDGALLAQAGAV